MTEKKRSLFVEEKTLIVKLRQVGPVGWFSPAGVALRDFKGRGSQPKGNGFFE